MSSPPHCQEQLVSDRKGAAFDKFHSVKADINIIFKLFVCEKIKLSLWIHFSFHHRC